MGFLLVLDTLIPHLHFTEEKPEGVPSQLKKTTMLVLAVTLHNIPEGMAVGVTFAGVMTEKFGNLSCRRAGAFDWDCNSKLSGRGNYIHASAKSWIVKRKGIFIRGNVRHCRTDCGGDHHFSDRNRRASPSLSLSFAAGAMIYVVVEELIPESQAGEHSNIGTIGVAAGFVLMMILDVALG